jgi:hypothetical protein
MNRTCNIDARGRVARLIWGIILLLGSALLAILWAWPSGWWLAWAASFLIAASGFFAVYEAKAGWCALRAMGFKTPM